MTSPSAPPETGRAHDEPDALPADEAALGSLLPRVVVSTFGVVVVFVALRGSQGSKTWDTAMFFVAVFVAGLLCAWFVARPPSRLAGTVTLIVASGALLFGIARFERPMLPGWNGFGISIALGAAYLVFYFWRVMELTEASRTLRIVFTTVIAVVAANDLASLVRTLKFLDHAGVNVYVLNELLAPAAGRVPDANFVPQYVSLFGWLLVPLRSWLSPWDLTQSAAILASVLAIVAVGLGVRIAARTLSPPSLWLAAGIVVPLTCVTASHGTNPVSSIGAYFPALPVRIFPAMLLTLLAVEELARLRAGSVRDWHLPALGVLTGLIAWNSKDIGLAASVALCLVLPVALPRSRWTRSMALWVGGLVAGIAVYPLITVIAGTPVDLAYFGLFSRAFAGGTAAVRVQVPGPVLVVLPVLLSSAAVGWCVLWRRRRDADADVGVNDRAVLTLTLVGTWSTGGFMYYLNRSFAAEQLQTLLLPFGVCIVALVSLARDARTRAEPAGADSESLRRKLRFYPIALLAALGLMSMLQSPNPVSTRNNHVHGRDPFTSKLISTRAIDTAMAYVHRNGGTLGYFGNNGSYIHLLTGLPNPLLFDDPTQLTNSPTLRDAACRYLDDHATDWLLTSDTDETATGPDVCGTYHAVDVAGLPPHTLFSRTRR